MDEAADAFGMRPQDFPIHRNTVDPLVIDLDGTLLRTNILFECALAFLKRNPLGIFPMLVWLMKGRATLKQELARRVTLDTAALPLNAAVEAFVVGEKSRGRKVYLATAADRSIAQSIADRCGFFDGVLASDGHVNLKGRHKLEALRHLFRPGLPMPAIAAPTSQYGHARARSFSSVKTIGQNALHGVSASLRKSSRRRPA